MINEWYIEALSSINDMNIENAEANTPSLKLKYETQDYIIIWQYRFVYKESNLTQLSLSAYGSIF